MFNIRELRYMFRAKDFKTYMSLCFLYCFVLGLFPYKIESSKYIVSARRFTCSTILMIIVIASCIRATYVANTGDISSDVPLLLHYNFFFVLTIISICSTHHKSREGLRIIQCLSRAAQQLPPRKFDKLSKWMHAKDALDMLAAFYLAGSSYGGNRTVWICSIHLFLGLLAINILYMNYIVVAKACFERMNESLLEFGELLVRDEPHLLRKVYHAKKNPLLLKQLRAIKMQHLEVSKIVQCIGETFGTPILCDVVLFFVGVTFSVYYVAAFCIDSNYAEVSVIYLLTPLYYLVKFVWMVWNCDAMKDQARFTGANIHRIITSTYDEQVRVELELFSIQVFLHDNTISAKGLKIDAPLLTSLASSFTTYLLVLLQFKLNKYF